MLLLSPAYRKFTLLLFILGIFFVFRAEAQKSKKKIDIEQADSFEYNDKINADVQRLIGNVRIRHNTILMWCDSAYSYRTKNMVDAFGHVHVLKDDTLHLYADFINYDGDSKFAKARNNVKLINKKTTLTTDSLDFDIAGNVGYYDYFGTVSDSTNVLTSVIGQYFTKTDMAHFKTDVVATTEKYRLFSDTLIYNVEKKIVYIVGPTTFEDDSTTLYTEGGFYDSETGEIQLLKKPVITDQKHKIMADSIFYNKSTGNGKAVGQVFIEDFENHMIVKGNRVVFNEIEETSMVTDSALYIQYTATDSLFLHADTLRTMPDTSAVDAKLIRAYYKVKFFRSDMQGKCDSLVYWSKDSTIQLFHEPVIWTSGNQMTGEYIEMIKNTGKPDEVKMEGDAFIIAMEPDSIRFNQIKGRMMTGYIRDNELYKILVDGNGQSLYYARDNSGIIGLNKAESSSIIIGMEENKVKRISFVSKPEGVLNPLFKLEDDDTKLPGFNWLDNIRPKEIIDIFLQGIEELKTPAPKKDIKEIKRKKFK